jgi:hypothetical protein
MRDPYQLEGCSFHEPTAERVLLVMGCAFRAEILAVTKDIGRKATVTNVRRRIFMF